MNEVIANKLICLCLNAQWQPVGMKTVKDAIIDLCGSNTNGKPSTLAIDIDYELDENGDPILDSPKSMNPLSWNNWLELPIRSWDLTIKSPNRSVRVPTVLICTNFNKMPVKHFRGKPSKDAIYKRDNGICQYTGKKIDKTLATVDHILPKSRGGQDTWTNLVLCSKDVNLKKGNSLNSDIGLKLLKNPAAPSPIPMSALIREARHADWMPFMIK
jgi:5-methylcytosine-specific restriction endonuclease McrA